MPDRPPKAYKNLDFLNSADARILRILAEYLEPRSRFRKNNVEDTIVFFGSARMIDRETAEEYLKVAEEKYQKHSSKENFRRKALAEKKLELSQYYEDAVTLARLITEWSMSIKNSRHRFLITSGGGPGIMEAANRGAAEVPGGRNVGLNISIPMEQNNNPYITEALNFEFHYFFTRKFWFVYLAKALVIFPGGFGTLDELFEVLTLLQTGKVQKRMPVVLYGETYWRQLINFDVLVDNLMVNEEDLNLMYFANTPQEAFEYLRQVLTEKFLT
jgi:uncharacterized protein (TIGR00730 family)